MCPGMAFGLAHIELALAALLFHFDWDLPEGMVPEELDMTEAAGITTRLRSDLLVIAVPRAPVPSEYASAPVLPPWRKVEWSKHINGSDRAIPVRIQG
jgi:hypothetical protein